MQLERSSPPALACILIRLLQPGLQSSLSAAPCCTSPPADSGQSSPNALYTCHVLDPSCRAAQALWNALQ